MHVRIWLHVYHFHNRCQSSDNCIEKTWSCAPLALMASLWWQSTRSTCAAKADNLTPPCMPPAGSDTMYDAAGRPLVVNVVASGIVTFKCTSCRELLEFQLRLAPHTRTRPLLKLNQKCVSALPEAQRCPSWLSPLVILLHIVQRCFLRGEELPQGQNTFCNRCRRARFPRHL